MSKGTTYLCPWCDNKVTVYVNTKYPPMHQCGGSSRPEKYLPMVAHEKKSKE